MRLSIIPLIFAVHVLFAATIEIGSADFSSNKPFCANWTSSLRYQLIVQGDIFAEPITIRSIAFDAVPGTGEETTLYELYVDMGYCSSNELVTVYEENYIAGTKERVFQSIASVVVTAASPEIILDVPFLYDPAEGNLLVDVIWPDGEGEFYTYNFATAGVSSIAGAYDLPDGYAFTDMSHIFLSDGLSLNQTTFAGVKKNFK